MEESLFFTKEDLLDLGFEPVREGGYQYYQYVFDKSNYLASGALVTNEHPESMVTDHTEFTVQLSRIFPIKDLTYSQAQSIINIYK